MFSVLNSLSDYFPHASIFQQHGIRAHRSKHWMDLKTAQGSACELHNRSSRSWLLHCGTSIVTLQPLSGNDSQHLWGHLCSRWCSIPSSSQWGTSGHCHWLVGANCPAFSLHPCQRRVQPREAYLLVAGDPCHQIPHSILSSPKSFWICFRPSLLSWPNPKLRSNEGHASLVSQSTSASDQFPKLCWGQRRHTRQPSLYIYHALNSFYLSHIKNKSLLALILHQTYRN